MCRSLEAGALRSGEERRTASEYVTVTTADNDYEARRRASGAVTARLASCAQVSAPITSTY